MYSKLVVGFERYFGRSPQFFVSSSGRVNLIGEHIDYHNGIVLPCAISLKNYLVGRASENYEVIGYNLKSNKEFRVNIDGPNIYEKGSSNAYIYGVCRSIIDTGYFIKGINFVIDGDLPIGSGLSSSASFCCGLIELISNSYRLGIEGVDIAKIARIAENKYAGVPCGIMDQMAIVFGKKGRLVKIDCGDLSVDYCHMPEDISIVIVNTLIKRQLAKSEYEKRQVESGELLNEIRRLHPEVGSLRDVSMDILYKVKDKVSDTIFKRGKYVLEEIWRVDALSKAMNRDDVEEIGKIMYDGHRGLRYEYEVSCDELDLIVEETYKFKGAIAARMTGAGFGGCAVSLIKNGFENEYSNYIKEKYRQSFNKDCEVYIVGQPSDGLVSLKL